MGMKNGTTANKMANYPDLLFPLGGGDEIGASSYLLQVSGRRVLIDAGLRLHGPRAFPDYSSLSQIGLMGLYECDCVCLTHAHLDHTGSLPAVYEKTRAKGHKTPIYATGPSKDIAAILLSDTVKIKKAHGEYGGDVEIQEFEKQLVQDTVASIREVGFHRLFEAAPGIQVTYFPAGHILGAAMIMIEIGGFRALFSGDFCGDGQKSVSGYRLSEKLPEIDLLVCESTYAYRKTDVQFSEQQETLIAQIETGIKQGGKVLIPAFAVGRSQEVLMLLRLAREAGQLSDDFPIYTDGMVNQVCEIYNTRRDFLSQKISATAGHLFFSEAVGIQASPFDFRRPGTLENFQKSVPCCIIASSGMLIGGSRSAAYASAMIEDPRNMILFTGYLDEESPGNKLLQANAQLQKFWLNNKEYKVGAHILPYHLSAHASLRQITDLVERVNPKQVVFVHGYADHENPENLFSKWYEWGKRTIQPAISSNQGIVYLG